MKTINLILAAVIFTLTIVSCEKEVETTTNNLETTELKSEISEVRNILDTLSTENYSIDAVINLRTEADEAETALKTAKNQSEVDKALSELSAALTTLLNSYNKEVVPVEPIDTTPTINYTVINSTISKIEDKLNNIDSVYYPIEYITNLDSIIKVAKTLLTSDNQTDIDNMVETINEKDKDLDNNKYNITEKQAATLKIFNKIVNKGLTASNGASAYVKFTPKTLLTGTYGTIDGRAEHIGLIIYPTISSAEYVINEDGTLTITEIDYTIATPLTSGDIRLYNVEYNIAVNLFIAE